MVSLELELGKERRGERLSKHTGQQRVTMI